MLCCTAQNFAYYALINAQYLLPQSDDLLSNFEAQTKTLLAEMHFHRKDRSTLKRSAFDCSIRVTDYSIRVY